MWTHPPCGKPPNNLIWQAGDLRDLPLIINFVWYILVHELRVPLVNTSTLVHSAMASRSRVLASCVGYRIRTFHSSRLVRAHQDSYQFVVAGGGAGGLAVASTLTNKFGTGRVAVVEPADVRHIYVHVHVCRCWGVCYEDTCMKIDFCLYRHLNHTL